MEDVGDTVAALGLPVGDPAAAGTSPRTFDDGAQYRVEIPSVEGPEALQAVIDTADEYRVPVHRVSQGSGIMLQTDAEIDRMVALGRQNGIEVCLFVGPRASWDVGAQARADTGMVVGGSLRGADQLAFGVEDVRRGCELGLRSVLVGDLGQLWVLNELRSRGALPADLVLKTSVTLPAANPATARVLEGLGATTINLPVDLSVAQIAAIREAVTVPLDMYIEAADDFGGSVRYYELPEIVRVAAPVYLKFTVRNAPGLYPAGGHLRELVLSTARERVRRAAIGLGTLERAAARPFPRQDGTPPTERSA
ncbi:U32 family peptidase [Egibacter rhizosphaerae]|uniref:U32 family peptidase n=1 Tax=Egibacter rhizosphaerae TaxID=1670831 RepID=UPI00197A882A|nr:U32 family peptidase [Egibacter rhizosphaerae]